MSEKDIRPYNNNGRRHGYWQCYNDDSLWYKYFFHNGKLIGYGEYYSFNINSPYKTFNII